MALEIKFAPGAPKDEEHEEEVDSKEEESTEEMIGKDLCKALEEKDYKAVGEILKAAFDLFESEPHEEAEAE